MIKFEAFILGILFLGGIQLAFGLTYHAFYTVGVSITITLLAILIYLRNIYEDKK
jgi:hypothetical protein